MVGSVIVLLVLLRKGFYYEFFCFSPFSGVPAFRWLTWEIVVVERNERKKEREREREKKKK